MFASTQFRTSALLHTTWRYYNDAGNTRYVVTDEDLGGGMMMMSFGGGEDPCVDPLTCGEGETLYTATRLEYARNGQALTYAIGEAWCWDGSQATVQKARVRFAREFRYDGGRQRYMNRKWTFTPSNPATSCWAGSFWIAPGDTTWTDYDGDGAYLDWDVDYLPEPFGPTVSKMRGFEAGVGRIDPWAADGSGLNTDKAAYYASDMLGTTKLMTEGTYGDPATGWGPPPFGAPSVFTAFGERITGPLDGASNRYGYVGAHGYQSHDSAEMPFLHLGARYYDPASGRFLQRDPIGIAADLNVYAYVGSVPTVFTDPMGLDRYYVRVSGHSEVWFDDPDRPGNYRAYDFGPAAGGKKSKGLIPGTKGGINRNDYGPGSLPEGATPYWSTLDQDREDLDGIERQRRRPPRFSIYGIGGQNCMGWASDWATKREPPRKPTILY